GADELFAGYLQSRQDYLHDRQHVGDKTFDEERGQLRLPAETTTWLSFVNNVLTFVPSWIKRLAIGRSIFHHLLHPDYIRHCQRHNPYQIFLDQFDIEGQLRGRERVIQSLYLWTRSILPNYSLYAERLEMAFAVEARPPFLDHKLFELVRKMPAAILIQGTQEKYILRQAMCPYLTNTVYRRHKHPFLAPPIQRNSPIDLLVQDSLRGSLLSSLPFFDRNAVIALLDRLPNIKESMRISLEPVIMMILSACLLQRHYCL
ncbi:MAG: asparagine synthase-related protein, partial [Acidobacteriota bacterium]